MERIFVGLVKCGAWGCFDEFNRLKEVTMSSVSTQIQLIQASLRSGKGSVRLMDQEIHLDHNCGIFITMNPAGKGYGDRRQLPNNLKQLFRPVVMSQPDNNLIAEQVKNLYSSFSKILTKQQHYDWGLRALKTVLHGCGASLKEVSRKGKLHKVENGGTVLSEEEVARNSLKLHTLSKLTPEDCTRFESLINDIFSIPDTNIEINEIHDAVLADVIRRSFESIGLIENERQSLAASGKNIKVHTINPKAMPRTSLLGNVDPETREWSDGILTLTAQQVYAEPPDVWSWLILDGDIDPEWIECLNSVLDDNRLLTLPSGWRIQFGQNVNFIFETHDLCKASPATISRIGVILLSEADVEAKVVINSWMKNKSNSRLLAHLIDDYLYKAVEWVANEGEVAVGKAAQTVALLQSVLVHLEDGVDSKAQFAVALIRGLGSNLSVSSRENFAKQADVEAKVVINSWMKNKSNSRLLAHLIDDYLYKAVEWVANEGEVAVGKAAQTVALLQSVLVHLEDGVDSKAQFAVALIRGLGSNLSVSSRENFAKQVLEWMGEGLSQSIDLNNLSLRCYYNSERGIIDVHRTERRRAEEVCMAISNNTGRVYQPKNAENLILFFKNIHLVKPDKWGTNMLISFLEQLIAYHGFHDDNLEWIGLDKVQIIGTMSLSPSEAQKIMLSSRFLASVRIFSMSYTDKEQLTTIYNTSMSYIVGEWIPKFQHLKTSGKIPMLVESMIKIYLEVLVYEACCIFRDKLVKEEDQSKFDNIIRQIMETDWKMADILDYLKGTFYVTDGNEAAQHKRELPPSGLPLFRLHHKDWLESVKKAILQYEKENESLGLIIIPELVQTVAKVERILTTPGGSLLLIGRSGYGRRSAIKIASSRQGARLICPSTGLRRFSKDLKWSMQLAGVEGEQVYLLVEDHHIEDESALDMVLSVLSAGEVPGLHTSEELDSIGSSLRDFARQEDFPGSLMSYFIGSMCLYFDDFLLGKI
ncbi:hypothetical protein J437_LFUL002260 [Ladona fulva]|uniref:Dynein heavy chain n=1 Tax=Ladona fulva TaxID=123851 RepID=A0A8K0JYG8_LADFU|nr:hypothetical protein J437_LFUL002260 [Ladona fulva]